MATNKINHSNPQYIKGKREDRQRITMIKVSTRIDTDLTVVIEECHLEVELCMGRIIEGDHNMLIIIEVTLGEEILGKCKIIEVSITEVDVETTTEMTVLEEVEIGLGKDNTPVI